MWKKIAISGAVAAAIIGSGAAALAETSTSGGLTSGSLTPGSTPASTPTTGASAPTTAAPATAKTGKLRDRAAIALRSIEHGEWTTRDKAGQDVVHDAIGGTVTGVNATSISVKAADGFTATYTVGSATKVHVKGTKPATIADVKVNDRVVVAGTKSGSTVTATQVLDAGTK